MERFEVSDDFGTIAGFTFGEVVPLARLDGYVEVNRDTGPDGLDVDYESLDGSHTVSTLDGRFFSFGTSAHFWVRGHDLIGVGVDTVIEVMGRAPDDVEEYDSIDALNLHYDEPDLSVWVSDGVVANVLLIGPESVTTLVDP